jgi:hypothetical protein
VLGELAKNMAIDLRSGFRGVDRQRQGRIRGDGIRIREANARGCRQQRPGDIEHGFPLDGRSKGPVRSVILSSSFTKATDFHEVNR